MVDVLKSVQGVLRAWLAVILPAILLISCSSGSSPNNAGGGNPPGTVYAGVDECFLCHYPDDSIARFSGMDIVNKWLNGAHGNNETITPGYVRDDNSPDNTGFPYYAGSSLGKDPDCTPGVNCPQVPGCALDCHDQLGDGELLNDFWIQTGISRFGIENRPIVGCESCHGKVADHAGTVGLASPQYTVPGPDRCGQCHDVFFGVNPLIFHDDLYTAVISDTHYDDPSTSYGAAPNIIEGYTMDTSNVRACLNCHDVHSVDVTINRQWARSAHGGFILEAKDEEINGGGDIDDIKAVGAHDGDPADPGFAPAWVHYDWDADNRAACQRCHTATGVKNYLTAAENSAVYVESDNDFSHLEGWVDGVSSSGQNEMLYCWGCHDSVRAGTLRNPGPITEIYNAIPLVEVAYPDITRSNVCMACHLGREIGEVISVSTDDFTDKSFVNSHYLAAGPTLFKVSGYEFSGAPGYNNLGDYEHDSINEDDEGPCVSCHMGVGTADHTIKVVEKNGSDEITGINSNVCVDCHNDIDEEAFDADNDLQDYKAGYHAALEVFEDVLASAGLHFGEAHPYFYSGAYDPGYIAANPDPCVTNLAVLNWQAGGTTAWAWDPVEETCADTSNSDGTPGTGKDRMGAAFNYNLLAHDPGAFAHNSHYIKLLVFDSIDYLEDGSIDGTIDLTGYPEAADYLKPGYGDISAVTRP